MSSSSPTDSVDVTASAATDAPVTPGAATTSAFGPGAHPPVAAEVFGPELDRAERYAQWLAGPGVERGLIGPAEVERLWDRHLLNCALLADLVPSGAHLADLGSGAGLPGLPVALTRPDLRVTLVDSRLRRTAFLDEVVADLALTDRVEVVRARGEDLLLAADVVTARAVSDLATVGRWSAGLVHAGGLLLALQGATARRVEPAQEADLAGAGWHEAELRELSRAGVTPTWVVRAVFR